MTTRASLKDLTVALVWRELALRYKGSLLGVGWALAEPIFLVATYVVFFGTFLRANAGVPDYLFFVMFGTLPWIFLSSTLDQSANTILEHAHLARKIPFPWEILFIAIGVSRLSTLLLALVLALAGALAFANDPAWAGIVWLPVGLVTMSAIALGGGLIVGALQPVFRDVSFLSRYAVRILFYAVPIAYPLQLVPAELGQLYFVNPLVGVVWMFQAPFAETAPPAWALAWSLAFSLMVLAGGWAFFRRMRSVVADLL